MGSKEAKTKTKFINRKIERMNEIKYQAPCLFGLESVLAFEVKKIGGGNVVVNDGKVCFTGDISLCAKANLYLSVAERVLIVLGEFKAKSFEELFTGVKSIPLEDYVGKNDAFPVKGYSLNSALHSVPDCQSIIKKACVERLKSKYNINWFEETGALYQLQFSILKDNVTICLDTSGAGLHKRGYRRNSNDAPIKETLAAGIIDLARIRQNSIVCDPFCGSGTFLIESAFKALNIAPGLRRKFTAESWNILSQDVWKLTRQEAVASVNKEGSFHAFGSDNDAESVELSKENSVKAGVTSKVSVSLDDVKNFIPKEGSVTICNPPYGERMLELKQAEELYRIMGQVFRPSFDTPCYIISPHEEFENFFGKKADRKRKLYNGMIKCQLFMYFK